MMPTRRQFAALRRLLASVLGSAAPAFGAHSSFGYLRRLRVNFPRAANGFTTASQPPPRDIEVGRLGHAQSLLSPTRLSSTRLIPLIGFRANLVGEAGNIATRPLCGWETPDHIGEMKLLSGKALSTTSRKARTLALTRRRELWSTQISTGGPPWVPQHANRPVAMSSTTRIFGSKAAPAPAKTASRTNNSDERRSTGSGLSTMSFSAAERIARRRAPASCRAIQT